MADAEAEALRKQRAADEKADRDAATRMVIDELKILYKQKLLPVEQTFLWVFLSILFIAFSDIDILPSELCTASQIISAAQCN